MEDTPEVQPQAKKELSPEEVYRRSVKEMSNKQLSNHLRGKLRKKDLSMPDTSWATVLSIVFDSKVSSYLR